jgi:hypothetical protein
MTEFGAGWLMGGGGPQAFAESADKARRAWHEADLAGEPRLAALAYVSLGDDAETHARRYLRDYYSFTGEFAERIAASALTSASQGMPPLWAYGAGGPSAVPVLNAWHRRVVSRAGNSRQPVT